MNFIRFLGWKFHNTKLADVFYGLSWLFVWAGLISVPVFGIHSILVGVLFCLLSLLTAGACILHDQYREWIKNEAN